jgi:hypothetical protein
VFLKNSTFFILVVNESIFLIQGSTIPMVQFFLQVLKLEDICNLTREFGLIFRM